MILILLISGITFDSLMNEPFLKSAQCGICVYDLDQNAMIYRFNAEKLLVPASNMKIITTAAALQLMGPDHRFITRLAFIGKEDNGIINGDLLLIGGGDPTFGLDQIEQLAVNLKKNKIQEINGNIIIDDSYFVDFSLNGNNFTFERLPIGWSWHYLDARYAAEISAMACNENCVTVEIRHTNGDSTIEVSLNPETEYVHLMSQMSIKEGEDSIIIYRRPENNVIYVSGGIRSGRKKDIPVAVKDPAIFAGYCFLESLKKNGIKVQGSVRRQKSNSSISDTNRVVIDSILSMPLVDILRTTNVESINLYAETLIKNFGAKYYGEGTFNKGLIMVRSFLNQCGVDTSNISLWDGSGLSRYNLITSEQMVQVLGFMFRSVHREIFINLLPVVGEGTLENRFKDFEGKLRAKTGSIHAVSCLSGYFMINEHNYCFSMMFNNFTNSRRKIEEIQEKIIIALHDYFGTNH